LLNLICMKPVAEDDQKIKNLIAAKNFLLYVLLVINVLAAVGCGVAVFKSNQPFFLLGYVLTEYQNTVFNLISFAFSIVLVYTLFLLKSIFKVLFIFLNTILMVNALTNYVVVSKNDLLAAGFESVPDLLSIFQGGQVATIFIGTIFLILLFKSRRWFNN